MAIILTNIFNDKLKLALCPGVCLLAPKHVSSDNFLNSNTHSVNINKVFVGMQECNYLKNIRRNSTFRAKGLCWELVNHFYVVKCVLSHVRSDVG